MAYGLQVVVGLLAGRQFLLLKVLGAHWLDNKIDVYCVRGAVTEQRKTFETCNLPLEEGVSLPYIFSC